MIRQKLALLFCLALAPYHAADVEWPVNGGPYNIRYIELTQITPANVGRLQVAWTYDSHDAFKDSEMQSNPIIVDGVLYATTPKLRRSRARRRAPGAKIWSFDPAAAQTVQRRFRHRGVTVYKDRVFVTYRNLSVGARPQDRQADPDLRRRTAASTCARASTVLRSASPLAPASPGVIFEDLIILGSTVPETLPGVARPHSRLRCEYRQAALDLPHHSASRRVRLRDLVARRRRKSTAAPTRGRA